ALNAARLQQFSQSDDERSFAAASHRDVAHAHHWARQLANGQRAAIIERVSDSHAGAEDRRKRIHGFVTAFAGSCNSDSRACRVRTVAPLFSRKSLRARSPILRRPSGSASMRWNSLLRSPAVTT